MGSRRGIMRGARPGLCLALAVACLLAGCAGQAPLSEPPAVPGSAAVQAEELQAPAAGPDAAGVEAAEPLLQCIYYERDLFLAGMANPCNYEDDRRPVAGIVPHHLLAADMLSGFFTLASRHSYDTVVILAPSHYPEQCGSFVVTSSRSWETPFGVVETDTELAGNLLSNGVIAAENNHAAMEYDHGGAGLVPYVAHYMPGTQVLVCLVSVQTSEARMAALRQMLYEYGEEKSVLLVASADFSHYQQPEDAAVYDAYTEQSIAAFDYDAISLYSSKNVDSPQALTAFLRTVEYYDAELVQLDHSSSQAKITAGLSNPVFDEGITTYFVYVGFSGP